MLSWAQKRRLTYGTIAAVFVILVVGLPSFLIFYRAPTCFDNKQNGGEFGIDCGGKCERLCQSSFFASSVAWTRFEMVVPGTYNIASYVINPNTDAEAKEVPFNMSLYDREGMLIITKSGNVTIPPHRNILAFSSLVNVGQSIPSRSTFEFSSPPNWEKKKDSLPYLSVISKDYSEEENRSSLLVKIRNSNSKSVQNLIVFSILYDKEGNVVGFSKTKIDEIGPNSIADAPFTWNYSRDDRVVSIEVLYMAE